MGILCYGRVLALLRHVSIWIGSLSLVRVEFRRSGHMWTAPSRVAFPSPTGEGLYDPEAYDEELDEWELEESHRVGKDGRTDSFKSVLESLSLAEVAGRLEQAFELLRGIDLDVTNLLHYITRLQGTNADNKRIQ